MKTFLKWAQAIGFNASEMVIIWLCGLWIGLENKDILILLVAWLFARRMRGKPMHYKKWQMCLLMSTAIFLSLFVVAKADVLLAVLAAVLAAVVLSGYSDVFMWSPRGQSKFQDEMDFVRANQNNPYLQAFESKLANDKDHNAYVVYKQIFVNDMRWENVANNLGIETTRITPIVERIAFCLRQKFDI